MIAFLSKIATGKFILFLFFFNLLFTAYLFPKYQTQLTHIAGEEVKILDIRPTYTFEEVNDLFAKIKPEGRAIYQYIASFIDMLYPFAYGLLLVLLLASFINRFFGSSSKLLYLALFPLFIMVFDFLENTNTLSLLAHYPDITTEMVEKGAQWTRMKWLCTMISIGMVVLGTIGLMVKMVLKKPE